VESRRAWVARATAGVEEKRRYLEQRPPPLPDSIVLPAVGTTWVVEYRPGRGSDRAAAGARGRGAIRMAATAVARERTGGRIVVTGDVADPSACRAALCRWLRRKARKELAPRLAGLALRHGFEYRRVSVRQQRTRWASCSRRGTISLNARLLFVPPEVVDYVLLHELCHTRELNHSRRFWTQLEAYDPAYRAHKKELRAAGVSLPAWLDHEPRRSAP